MTMLNNENAKIRIKEVFPEIDLNELKSIFKDGLKYEEYNSKEELENYINSLNLNSLYTTVIPIYGASHIFLNPFKINCKKVLVFVNGVLRGYCGE